MHLQCPHCHNPIEIVTEPAGEMVCPSCGSTFRVDLESTYSWEPGERRIGRFELIERLGLGASGTVFKARDPELDRIVALKVPRTGNIGTPKDVERFLREARSAGQLKHPAIVAVHEVGAHEGVPYIVSDFVEGATLSDWLSANGRPMRCCYAPRRFRSWPSASSTNQTPTGPKHARASRRLVDS